MTIVYEDLCTNLDENMKKKIKFLGHTNDTQTNIALSQPETMNKKHTLKHSDMFSNYNQVQATLHAHGFDSFLIDEECGKIHNASKPSIRIDPKISKAQQEKEKYEKKRFHHERIDRKIIPHINF